MQAVLFGNNKKRKRGDVDGMDEDDYLDDDQKRRKKLYEERLK